MSRYFGTGLKKLAVFALALVMGVTFAACGESGNGGGGSNGEDDAVAPVISGFSIEADEGATYGKIGEAHKLLYTITGDCTSKTVSVKKDGNAAQSDVYEYTEQTRIIAFKEAGAYTVTLTAMNGEKGTAANANVTVTAFDAPVITTQLAQNVYENTAFELTPAATYAQGDAEGSYSVTVVYSATADGEFAAATAAQYTYADNQFTAKAVGYYKITVSAISLKGVTGSQEYAVQCVKIGAMNLSHDYGTSRIAVQKGEATPLNYTATGGNAEDFDVTYEYDQAKLAVEGGEGNSVVVTASELGNYTVKVIYTHKANAEAVSDITFEITVKNDIQAPTLGSDPFGGTWATLMPNVGMMLYFDATDDQATLAYGTHVTYEVVSGGTLTADQVTIANAGGNVNYPYLVSATAGTVNVRITVTDDDGNASTAEKLFTVATPSSASAYSAEVYNGALGKLKFDDGSTAGRESLVVTKTGVIANRENVNLDGTIGMINVNRDAQFTLEFDLTIVANNPADSGFNSLFFTLWTGPESGDGWAGNMGMNWTTTQNAIGGASWTTEQNGNVENNKVTTTAGTCAANETVHLTVTRRVENDNVYWKVELTYNGTTTTILSYDAPIVNTAGKNSADVNNIALNHFDMGTYILSNFNYTAN